MISIVFSALLLLDNTPSTVPIINYVPSTLKNQAICNEVVCGVIDENSGFSILAVGLITSKLTSTPVNSRSYYSKYNVSPIVEIKKRFGLATTLGLDYSHLIEPYNGAQSFAQVEMLNADYNRTLMAPEFNRTGLWKSAERFVEKHILMQPTLIDISGGEPSLGFYKIIINPNSRTVIAFNFPPESIRGSLDTYITSIGCINKQYNINLLEDYQGVHNVQAWSLDIWAINGGIKNETCN